MTATPNLDQFSRESIKAFTVFGLSTVPVWKLHEFAIAHENGFWLIIHVPSGTFLSKTTIEDPEIAAGLVIELLKIRNSWDIGLNEIRPDEIEQVISLLRPFAPFDALSKRHLDRGNDKINDYTHTASMKD